MGIAEPLARSRTLPASARRMVVGALREDVGSGDVTTRAFVPPEVRLRAFVRSRREGIVCGLALAAYAFERCGGRCRLPASDGSRARPGKVLLEVAGPPSILSAERVALNFLQRLSGVATLTRAYVERGGPIVFDTRKTTPLWRELEKYAVRCGGGRNHRSGLFDAGLVKDNHWEALGAGPKADERFRRGVERFRKLHPGLELEVEVEDERQLRLALEAGADVLLLDNMSPARLRAAIREIRGRRRPPKIEISGGVDLGSISALARLRPDRVSIGRLTHSAPALDLGLDMAVE